MNQIVVSPSTLPLLDPNDRRVAIEVRNSFGRESVPADLRERLALFLAAADEVLLPADRSEINNQIVALMISYRSTRSQSRGEAEATLAAYADVLLDLPLWAIDAGIRKVRRGEVDGISLDFPPAAPRLRQVVLEVMRPVKADHNLASWVLRGSSTAVSERACSLDRPDSPTARSSSR